MLKRQSVNNSSNGFGNNHIPAWWDQEPYHLWWFECCDCHHLPGDLERMCILATLWYVLSLLIVFYLAKTSRKNKVKTYLHSCQFKTTVLGGRLVLFKLDWIPKTYNIILLLFHYSSLSITFPLQTVLPLRNFLKKTCLLRNHQNLQIQIQWVYIKVEYRSTEISRTANLGCWSFYRAMQLSAQI